MISPAQITAFHKKIFSWYAVHKRDLPWRQTTDPYAILISEVMLQQTQVDRVIPKYQAWLSVFPDFSSLAFASVADVLRLWSGLGYNSRALRLHRLAQDVVTQYHGQLPLDPLLLLQLPGIGPYTCKSVLIFAFNVDMVCVDTNIRRILIAELGLAENLSFTALETVALEVLPLGKSRDWHNALMDYGALQLTSRTSGIRPVSRQSHFLGSRRMYRGRILQLLIAQKEVSISSLLETLSCEEIFLRSIVSDLAKEGLIVVSHDVLRLP